MNNKDFIKHIEKLTINIKEANYRFDSSVLKMKKAFNNWDQALNRLPIDCIEIWFEDVNDKNKLSSYLKYYENKELYNICQAIKNIIKLIYAQEAV